MASFAILNLFLFPSSLLDRIHVVIRVRQSHTSYSYFVLYVKQNVTMSHLTKCLTKLEGNEANKMETETKKAQWDIDNNIFIHLHGALLSKIIIQ